MLQKVQKQKKCINIFIEIQNYWNKFFEEHLQKNKKRLKNFNNNFFELTQFIIRIDVRIIEMQISQHAH